MLSGCNHLLLVCIFELGRGVLVLLLSHLVLTGSKIQPIACPFQKSLGRFFENYFVDLHLVSPPCLMSVKAAEDICAPYKMPEGPGRRDVPGLSRNAATKLRSRAMPNS